MKSKYDRFWYKVGDIVQLRQSLKMGKVINKIRNEDYVYGGGCWRYEIELEPGIVKSVTGMNIKKLITGVDSI